jgi:hypothetical protein
MSIVALEYKKHFSERAFVLSFLSSLLLLIVALTIHFFAISYATENASNAVTDIVLSNIRVYDVHLAFIYGPMIMWFFVFVLLFLKPNQLPFSIKTVAIFVLIRSIFISLTHLGPFPTEIPISPESFINYFSSGGDLFFSAHTGLPFLLMLIFWQSKSLRIFFFICSIFFGAVVLMGHLHYSIDVLSAFFITFSIYKIAEFAFEEDKKYFDNQSVYLQ